MSPREDEAFIDAVKQHLDRHADDLDELTSARLQAIRRRALDENKRPALGWLPLGGLATAAVALLAVAIWTFAPPVTDGLPGDPELLAQAEDLELIEELDFYVWLEEIESNS